MDPVCFNSLRKQSKIFAGITRIIRRARQLIYEHHQACLSSAAFFFCLWTLDLVLSNKGPQPHQGALCCIVSVGLLLFLNRKTENRNGTVRKDTSPPFCPRAVLGGCLLEELSRVIHPDLLDQLRKGMSSGPPELCFCRVYIQTG
jgi:hypothetical protein